MEVSRLNKMLAGIFIIFIGIGLFLDNLGVMDFNIFPLIILYIGFQFWNRNKPILGGIILAIGSSIAFDSWFDIEIFDLIIPVAVIYFGFRLLRSRSAPAESSSLKHSFQHWKKQFQPLPNHIFSADETRSSLIGDFHLTTGRYEMRNLNIWHGVGNVVIDLSRALLPDEECFLVVNGWIGDVTIYVPIDLPVSVSAEVTVGDLEVLGHRQGGLNRQVRMSAQHYESSGKKVNIVISLIVGDIDVKYI